MAMEGRVIFDLEDRLTPDGDPEASADSHFVIRFGSLFASPSSMGQGLDLAVPANVRAAALDPAPPADQPAQLVRQAQETGAVGLLGQDTPPLDADESVTAYTIDPDRDTNITGLVYFANYTSFIELGERTALARGWPAEDVARRRVHGRRIVYTGHAAPGDALTISVVRLRAADSRSVGLRCRITRPVDGKLVCMAESVVERPVDVAQGQAWEVSDTSHSGRSVRHL